MLLSRALHHLLHQLAVAGFGALQRDQQSQRQQSQKNSANGLSHRRDTIHITAGSNVRFANVYVTRLRFSHLGYPLPVGPRPECKMNTNE